ncbi:hypothetical protein DMUE_5164 [Dictyocoela muelleri]|nr:hypothetical protein DMUE_5164 [Dictyocoela muelleri]
MEKLEFYLVGKKFTLISDHKAIEEIYRKKRFWHTRIQRWIERFSKFNFHICYRERSLLEQADTLSRMFISVDSEGSHKFEKLCDKVMRIHRECNHRRSTK